MRKFRRVVLGVFIAAMGMAASGAGGVPAMASADKSGMSAGSTIYVDDDSDGTQCKDALNITDLSTVTVQSGQTIILCSGEYSGPLTLTGLNKVKITGKADKTLGSPRIIPPNVYDGSLITVTDSTDVTISGLIIDGEKHTGQNMFSSTATQIAGISVIRSSVTISDNIITRMRRDPLDTVKTGRGIYVTAPGATAAYSVKISKNTIFDYQYQGIVVDDTGDTFGLKPSISSNLVMSAAIGSSDHAGIVVVQTETGTVSSNTVSGTWGYQNTSAFTTGIALLETQHVKVSGNTISGVYYGILATTHHLVQDLVGNTISGNKVTDIHYGIEVIAQLDATSTGPVGIIDTNVTKNTITNHAAISASGVVFTQQVSGAGTLTYSGNALTNNTLTGFGQNSATTTVDTDPTHFKVSGNKVEFLSPGK